MLKIVTFVQKKSKRVTVKLKLTAINAATKTNLFTTDRGRRGGLF